MHLVPNDSTTSTEEEKNAEEGPDELPPIPCFNIIDEIENTQRHSLLKVLGVGAMGQVHLALDNKLQRKVAYKEILNIHKNDNTILSRFLREAQITSQLEHPNIVPIYGLEKESSSSWAYTMKVVKGKTLKDIIKEKKELLKSKNKNNNISTQYSLETFLDIFLKASDAMAYAHSKGVIHRDLKPTNIMLGDYGEVYVVDWGLAKVVKSTNECTEYAEITETTKDPDFSPINTIFEEDTTLEKTIYGQLLGTPRYMSPEQAKGDNENLDSRSDQFALGLILYELLLLEEAYDGKNLLTIIEDASYAKIKPIKKTISSLSPVNPANSSYLKVPQELQLILSKALSLEKDDRYSSVQAFNDDIRKFLHNEALSIYPDSFFRSLVRWISKHRLQALSIILSLVLLTVAVFATSIYRHKKLLIASEERVAHLTHHQEKISSHASNIDKRFGQYESYLKTLAGLVIYTLESGQDRDDPIFGVNEFVPNDFSYSTRYRSPVSTESAYWGLKVANTDINRLTTLGPMLKRTLFNSHLFDIDNNLLPSNSSKEIVVDQVIREQGTPLTWVVLGFTNGSYSFYPGEPTQVKEYDPRIRPWYQSAKINNRLTWGAPYISSRGMGVMLPVSMPIYSFRNEFRGAIALEFDFDYIAKKVLSFNHPLARDSYLLDSKGRIFVSTNFNNINKETLGNTSDKFRPGIVHDPLNLKIYSEPSLLKEFADRKTNGHIIKSSNSRLVFFQKLNTIDWYYVVEFDPFAYLL
ncbi:MAG: protein kinase [Oligoflexia bacterium]|nr:protein kinase [Oligoflexia bacterium]